MRKFLIFIMPLLLVACGGVDNEGGKDAEFKSISLCADSVAINEVLAPYSCKVVDGSVLLVSENTSKALFHYRLPDWTFLDTMFARGEGPEDVGFPIFMDTDEHSVWLTDIMRGNTSRLSIKEGRVNVDTVYSQNITGVRIMVDAAMMGDRYTLERRSSGGDWNNIDKIYPDYLYVTDVTDGSIKDSMAVYSYNEIESSTNENGQISLLARIRNAPATAICGNKVLLYYPWMDFVQTFTVNDGHIENYREIGQHRTFEEVLAMDWKEIYENRRKYCDIIASDDKYIYLRVSEYEIESSTNEEGEKTINEIPHRLYVDVCDWELKPIVRYDLDKVSARECVVDIYNNKIYAWNSDLDFENVYIYSYNLK